MELWKWDDGLGAVREKVNGNFAALTAWVQTQLTQRDSTLAEVKELAAGKPEVVFGSYTGAYAYNDPTDTHITLGKRPLAVVIMPRGGTSPNNGGRSYGGILAPGYPIIEAGIADNTGFTVCNEDGSYVNLNQTGKVYYYLALV